MGGKSMTCFKEAGPWSVSRFFFGKASEPGEVKAPEFFQIAKPMPLFFLSRMYLIS
jgi:hypothetical protein